MANKRFEQLPSSDIIIQSPHELEDIQRRLSGIFINNLAFSENGILKLILSLANEISELKKENKRINAIISDITVS